MTTKTPKERPILFSGAMVRAILDGTKTQTRRLITRPNVRIFWVSTADTPYWCCEWHERRDGEDELVGVGPLNREALAMYCPYGEPGDRLWVRETHAIVPRTAYARSKGVQQTLRPNDKDDAAIYREGWELSPPTRWSPSIHMPRWASRLLLEVVSVRVERLQEISEADAKAEGLRSDLLVRHEYKSLWDKINGERASWSSNPWVWVVTFKKLEVQP